MLAFTMSFDDYVITSFVSGTGCATLPIVVYTMVRKNIEPSHQRHLHDRPARDHGPVVRPIASAARSR
jgi:hypothetical protein